MVEEFQAVRLFFCNLPVGQHLVDLGIRFGQIYLEVPVFRVDLHEPLPTLLFYGAETGIGGIQELFVGQGGDEVRGPFYRHGIVPVKPGKT